MTARRQYKTTSEERIDRFRMLLFKLFVRTVDVLGAYSFLARFCARYVTELIGEVELPAGFFAAQKQTGKKKNVLVLDLERFRGGVTRFSQEPDIRILNISWNFLRHLLASYVYHPTITEKVNHPDLLGIR